MAYLESTPLELSNDVKFVEILVKTAVNTIQYSKQFTYARRSHDRVQPPLDGTRLSPPVVGVARGWPVRLIF